MEYRSPSPLTSQVNDPDAVWQDNRYLGALILNKNLKFHRNNKQNQIDLKKTTIWTPLDDLKVKFSVELDRPALFFYNLALSGGGDIGARLLIDGNDIKSTYKRLTGAPYAGLFGFGAKILTQGDHEVTIEYVSSGST